MSFKFDEEEEEDESEEGQGKVDHENTQAPDIPQKESLETSQSDQTIIKSESTINEDETSVDKPNDRLDYESHSEDSNSSLLHVSRSDYTSQSYSII